MGIMDQLREFLYDIGDFALSCVAAAVYLTVGLAIFFVIFGSIAYVVGNLV